MRKLAIIFRILLILMLISVCCFYSTSYCNEKPIPVLLPKTIDKYEIGVDENQIPNFDEGGDMYTAPRSFFVDSKNNFYIFVVGMNRILKITPSNQKKWYDLNFADVISIYFDKTNNYIYALSSHNIIYVLDTYMKVIEKIDYSDIANKERLFFTKIKVIKNKIYIYQSDYNSLYVIEREKGKIQWHKDKYFYIENKFIKAINNSFDFNENGGFYCVDKNGKKKEIKMPRDISYACFLTYTEDLVYLFLVYSTNNIEINPRKLMIIDKDFKSQIIDLSYYRGFYGEVLPTVDVNNDGDIYYLCLTNNQIHLKMLSTKGN